MLPPPIGGELASHEMSEPKDTSKIELGARKWAILRAVVQDYVETAEPVGSEALVHRYRLDVRPATVRNEMAEMSDLGYLKQPHTSAGRIPSDSGYRYFVDHSEMPAAPEPDARARLRELGRSGDDLVALLAESCRLLARMSRYIALAGTASGDSVFLKQVILSPVGSERVLLVLVLSNGRVENRTLEAPGTLSITELGKANEAITGAAAGRSLRQLARARLPDTSNLPPQAAELAQDAFRELKATARSLSRGATIHDGIANLLAQPEFRRDVASLEEVLALLESGSVLEDVVDWSSTGESAVVIGSESGQQSLSQVSIVASRFYIGDEEAGTIGVLGPTRMRYAAAVSLVRYTSQVLSDTLTKMFRG